MNAGSNKAPTQKPKSNYTEKNGETTEDTIQVPWQEMQQQQQQLQRQWQQQQPIEMMQPFNLLVQTLAQHGIGMATAAPAAPGQQQLWPAAAARANIAAATAAKKKIKDV